MTHAKLENGTPVQPYPYTLSDLHSDHAGTSMPKASGVPVWPSDLETFNVVDVQATTPPVPTATQSVSKALPVLLDGVWTQQWTVRDWNAQEIADAQARLAETTRLSDLRAVALTDALRGMTAAQIDAHIDAANTVAKMQGVLKRLAKVVLAQ